MLLWVRIIGKRCCLVEVASFLVPWKGSPLSWSVDRRWVWRTHREQARSHGFQCVDKKWTFQKQQSPRISTRALFCMGTRRTVAFGEARFPAGLKSVENLAHPDQ